MVGFVGLTVAVVVEAPKREVGDPAVVEVVPTEGVASGVVMVIPPGAGVIGAFAPASPLLLILMGVPTALVVVVGLRLQQLFLQDGEEGERRWNRSV
jgi:hypothetical protein